MATVRVEPSGISFRAAPGETLMGAAVQAGVRWPTVCGGIGSCTTCFIRVLDGHDHLTPLAAPEAETLTAIRHRFSDALRDDLRLACQARVEGDVRVFKRGVS